MAQLPVWGTIRAALADVWSNRWLAARDYGIYLLASVTVQTLGLLSMRARPVAALLSVGLFFILLWVVVDWAGWVYRRAVGVAAPDRRYWSTVRAALKYIAVLLLAMIGVAILIVSGVVIMQSSAVAGGAVLALGAVAVAVLLWAAIRLSLLQSRAAIGEGSSLLAAWQATRGAVWRLAGISLLCAVLLLAVLLVMYVVAALVAVIAIRAGWMAPPAVSPEALVAWTQQRWARGVAMVAAILTSPVMAVGFLVTIGAPVRAALFLRAPYLPSEEPNPWIA